MHVDLRRRQPDARCGIHGLGHVGGDPTHLVVDTLDRGGNFLKAGVGEVEDREKGHNCLLI